MFKYTGNNTKILEAVRKANELSDSERLYEDIDDADQFDMTNAENSYIQAELEKFLHENDVHINVYYPKWRWSKAIGYFSADKPTTININGYKLNRSIGSFVGNFYHELTHMVSADDDNYSFDHGNNNPSGKENTAPYAIGEIAGTLVDVTVLAAETGNITYYIPWYKKVLRWFK